MTTLCGILLICGVIGIIGMYLISRRAPYEPGYSPEDIQEQP